MARLQRQTDATDHQIDRLVYELYGLPQRGDQDCGSGRRDQMRDRIEGLCQ
jgi:hypothetical protein